MKSFKKLLSVLAILAMLASFAPASQAVSYSYEDQANILYNLGLFKGTSTSSFVPDLGAPVTREQGVIQLVRTLGKESDALAMTDTDADKILIVFSDAKDIASWSKKYIAWAVNNKIVAGYPNGKFAPQDPLSGKAYGKLILSALGQTVDAAGYEAACFLMRDKGIIQWGTRGTLYYVLSFSEAQKFNDKEELIRDDLVALSYAALKLQYAANYSVTTNRNKSAIQVLIEAGKVTKDKAIAGYLYFRELMAPAEAAVAAYEAAPINSLAAIATAEGLKAAADTAVAEYDKGNVTGLAAIVNFNVKFNLNNAWVKADYDGFKARIAARATVIANAKSAEIAAQAAAQTALSAYVAAPITTLAEIAAAKTLGTAAGTAINACVDAAFKTAKLAEKAAKDTAVAAAEALLNGQVSDAQAAVTAYKNAPVTTPAQIDAALALFTTANAKVLAVQDPVANADLTAQLNAVPVVAGLKATGVKQLTVNFNRTISDAQKAAAVIGVKYTNNGIGTTATWSGNNVNIVKADGQILYAGSYTVTVSGVAASDLTATTAVEAEKPVSVTIDTDRLLLDEIDWSDQKLPLTVLNQYGEKMATLPGMTIIEANLTDVWSGDADWWQNADGSLWYELCCEEAGDNVRVTVTINNYPEISASKVLTVSKVYPATVVFGEAKNLDGTTPTRLVTGVSYYVPVSVTDNFGNAITPSCCLDDGNLNYVVDGSINLDSPDGWDMTDASHLSMAEIQFTATGTAKLVAVNPFTGTTTIKTFNVQAPLAPASLTLTAPAGNIRAGAADILVPVTVKDQDGGTIAAPVWQNADPAAAYYVSFGTTNPLIASLVITGGKIYMDVGAQAGQVTLTATFNGKVSSFTVTVLDGAVPTSIALSGTPVTALAHDQVVADSKLKFAVKDQDGNKVALSGNYKIALSLTPDTLVALGDSLLTTTDANGITNEVVSATAGATSGSATLLAQLFIDADADGVKDSDEATISAAVVTFVVSPEALTSATLTESAYVSNNAATTFTFSVFDQASRAFNVAANTTVTWTVTNGTGAALPITGVATALAAGATGTYTTTITAGNSATTLVVTPAAGANGKITVSAVTGTVSATALNLYSTNITAGGASTTYNGTVAMVDKTGDVVVLQTSIGYVVVNYAGCAFVIDGNTANSTLFETAVTVGDGLAIATDGAAASTITLTNK